MADSYIQYEFVCVQCKKPSVRPYRGSGVRPTLCGNACKIASYKVRNPEYARASRERELLKRLPAAQRKCGCGNMLIALKRLCDVCRLTTSNLSRSNKCRECGIVIEKWKQRCEPCKQIASHLSKEATKLSVAYKANKRKRKAMRRAVERGAFAESFDPFDIFARDQWACYICGCSTPKELRGTYAHNAPELDHVVAISKGGQHTRNNTACACRRCNIIKSDKPLTELRLVP